MYFLYNVAPEIRLDALERLMQLYGNQIDGKYLANTQNDIQEFHIPAKSPVKIKEGNCNYPSFICL